MKIALNLPQLPKDSSNESAMADPTINKVDITAHRFLPFHKCVKVQHGGKTYRVKAYKLRHAIDPDKKHLHSKDIQKLCRMAKIAAGHKHCNTDDIEKVMNLDVSKQDVLLKLSSKKRENMSMSHALLDAAEDENIDADALKLISGFGPKQLSAYNRACGVEILKPHKSEIINYMQNEYTELDKGLNVLMNILEEHEDLGDCSNKIPAILSYLDENTFEEDKVQVLVDNIDLLDNEAAKMVLERDSGRVSVNFMKSVFSYIREGQDVQTKEVDIVMSIAEMNLSEEVKMKLSDKFKDEYQSDEQFKRFFDEIDDRNEQTLALYLFASGADSELLGFMKKVGVISDKPTNFYLQQQFKVLCRLVASDEYDNQAVVKFAKKVLQGFKLHQAVLQKINKEEMDNISLGKLKAYLEWSQEDAVIARISKEQHLAQIELLTNGECLDDDFKEILDSNLNDVKQEYALQVIYGEKWENGLSEEKIQEKIDEYEELKKTDKYLENNLLSCQKDGKDVQKYYKLALMGFKSYQFSLFRLEDYGCSKSSQEEELIDRRFYETHFKILTKICEQKDHDKQKIPSFSGNVIAKLNSNPQLLELIEEMGTLDDPDLDVQKLLYLVNWVVENRAFKHFSDKNDYTQCLLDLLDSRIKPKDYLNNLKESKNSQ